ncbi:response regulator [Sulfitobacter sediminilitoris]
MLDLRIPDIDGIKLCRTVRQFKEYEKTPIMMITVAREEELIASAFSAGATDYIFKPFDVVELMKRVRIAEIIEDPVQARELALVRSGQQGQEQFTESMLTRLKVDRDSNLNRPHSKLSQAFQQTARYSTLLPKALRYLFMNGNLRQITKLLTSAKPDRKGETPRSGKALRQKKRNTSKKENRTNSHQKATGGHTGSNGRHIRIPKKSTRDFVTKSHPALSYVCEKKKADEAGMTSQQALQNDKLQLLQAGLARLKLEFIETLKGRVAELDSLMDELYEEDVDVEAVVETICQHAHKLHGQAGAFGFNDVGAKAAQLEQEILNAQEGAKPLNTEVVEAHLAALLDQIEASLDAV